jgi:hypothetical protein
MLARTFHRLASVDRVSVDSVGVCGELMMSKPKGDLFHIRIGQHLDAECAAWLAGLTITNLAGGEAMLSGTLADQS